jgi:hypothetical protein
MQPWGTARSGQVAAYSWRDAALQRIDLGIVSRRIRRGRNQQRQISGRGFDTAKLSGVSRTIRRLSHWLGCSGEGRRPKKLHALAGPFVTFTAQHFELGPSRLIQQLVNKHIRRCL